MAKKVDPKMLRTLGIVTKPDLVDEGAENTYIDQINNNGVVFIDIGIDSSVDSPIFKQTNIGAV